MDYDDARIRIAEWLERHAKTSPLKPHAGYDDIDTALPRGDGACWTKIFVALHFWDGWIDASNHEWRYYDPIHAADWPSLALEVAAALRANEEISNPVILEKFAVRPRKR